MKSDFTKKDQTVTKETETTKEPEEAKTEEETKEKIVIENDNKPLSDSKKVSGDFKSSKDLIETFWIGMDSADYSIISQCFPDPGTDKKALSNIDEQVDSIYNKALEIQDTIDIDISGITMETSDYEKENLNTYMDWAFDIEKAEISEVVIPMTQTINEKKYQIEDVYTITTVCIDGNWYLSDATESDVRIIDGENAVTDNTKKTTIGKYSSVDPLTINTGTDFQKVNWATTYIPDKTMPNISVSVAPMVNEYGDYSLICGITNMYNDSVHFSANAIASDDNSNAIGSQFVYFDAIGAGNTVIAVIECPDGIPTGDIYWEDLEINDSVNTYVPWEADWKLQSISSDETVLNYEVVMRDNASLGEVYGLILDKKGNVIDIFYEFVSDEGSDYIGSSTCYREDLMGFDVTDVALFINPTK